MSTELARKVGAIELKNMDDVNRLSEMFAQSGYFKDAREASQVGVKVLAGREMGFGPFASVNGIHLIQGKPAMGANLMAAAIKASGKYDYRVREMSNEACRIEYFQGAESIGISEFTIADARAAGTQNLQKFARNMLFARAMSNGVRWYTPDVFMGSAVYVPEELGAEVDGDGDVLDAQFRRHIEEPELIPEPIAVEPEDAGPAGITPSQVKTLASALEAAGFTRDHKEQAREFVSWLIDRDVASVRDLTEDEANRILLRWEDKRTKSGVNVDKVSAAVDEWSTNQQMTEEAA